MLPTFSFRAFNILITIILKLPIRWFPHMCHTQIWFQWLLCFVSSFFPFCILHSIFWKLNVSVGFCSVRLGLKFVVAMVTFHAPQAANVDALCLIWELSCQFGPALQVFPFYFASGGFLCIFLPLWCPFHHSLLVTCYLNFFLGGGGQWNGTLSMAVTKSQSQEDLRNVSLSVFLSLSWL